MNVYRCYLLHARDRIGAFENIEARELDEAVDRARAMLRQRPKHRAFEIWEGPNRLLSRQKANYAAKDADF